MRRGICAAEAPHTTSTANDSDGELWQAGWQVTASAGTPAQPAGCRMAGRGDRNMTRLRTVATAFGRKPDSRSARDQYARRRLRALCLAAFLVISAALAAGPTRLLPTCLVGCRPSQAGITAVGQPQCRPARPR